MRSGILPPYLSLVGANPRASGHERWVPDGWPAPFAPNFSDWRPGDIILVSAEKTLAGGGTVLAQSFTLNLTTLAGAIYSHAAIYLGNGMVVDAMPGRQVRAKSIWAFCRHRSVTLRRLPLEDIGADIAAYALTHLGEAYSVAELIRSKLMPKTSPDARRLYCSTFVGHVVAQATGVQLASAWKHRPLHPSTLATHEELAIVEVAWRPVAERRLLQVHSDRIAAKVDVLRDGKRVAIAVPTAPPHPRIPPV